MVVDPGRQCVLMAGESGVYRICSVLWVQPCVTQGDECERGAGGGRLRE